MATRNDRRSPRIVLRIPLQLNVESEGLSFRAETALVNEHGALVLSPERLSEGAIVQVENMQNRIVARFRVVWYGGEDLPGRHKLGLEMIDHHEAFWGAEHYDARAGLFEDPGSAAGTKVASLVMKGSRPVTSAADLRGLMADLVTVAEVAGIGIRRQGVTGEFHSAPHPRPGSLPESRQAVYGFMIGERCLKVGKVGPFSSARYLSHHYNPWSSTSSLANLLLASPGRLRGQVPEAIRAAAESLSEADVGAWIERSTSRFNILLDAKFEEYELSFLESFVQCRLKPVYEGRTRG